MLNRPSKACFVLFVFQFIFVLTWRYTTYWRWCTHPCKLTILDSPPTHCTIPFRFKLIQKIHLLNAMESILLQPPFQFLAVFLLMFLQFRWHLAQTQTWILLWQDQHEDLEYHQSARKTIHTLTINMYCKVSFFVDDNLLV